MTRNEAFEQATRNHVAHRKYVIDNLFGRTPAINEFDAFGYRHGWYFVAGFNFSQDEITGEQYDHAQGGWAYL